MRCRPGCGPVLLLLAFLLMPSRAWARGAPVHYFALFVGSATPPPGSRLPGLRYVDLDVLRMATVLRPLVAPSDATFLLEPGDNSLEQFQALGFRTFLRPGLRNFLEQLDALRRDVTEARRRAAAGLQIELYVYLSTHGDQRGIFLGDDYLTRDVLQAGLRAVGADQIHLIADACYSGVLKGAGDHPPEIRVDDIARALSIPTLGSITTDRSTIEDAFIRGGWITLTTIGAMIGAGDLNRDGIITYEEMATYLSQEQRTNERLRGVRARGPLRAPQSPPPFIVLERLDGSGLRIERRPGRELERYIIRNRNGEFLADFSRRTGRALEIHLPSGEYEVTCQREAEPTLTRSGWMRVAEGFEPVLDSDLPSVRVMSARLKGGTPVPTNAVPMDADMERYLTVTPAPRAVNYHDVILTQRIRAGFRVAGSYPLDGRGRALTQETASGDVLGVVDVGVARVGAGLVTAGAAAGLGASPRNRIGDLEVPRTVYRVPYAFRVGYLLERGLHSFAGHLLLGGIAAGPLGSTEAGASADPADYRIPWVGTLGLELSVSHVLWGGGALEVGGGPMLVMEPEQTGNGVVLGRYHAMSVFTGLRWR